MEDNAFTSRIRKLIIEVSHSGWYSDGEGVFSSRTGLFLFRSKGGRWRWWVDGTGTESIAFRTLKGAIDNLNTLLPAGERAPQYGRNF